MRRIITSKPSASPSTMSASVTPASPAPQKKCSRCETEKPLEAFHRDAKKSDGLSPWCKPCKNGRTVELHLQKRKDPTKIESIRRHVYKAVEKALNNGTLVKPEKCPVCRLTLPSREIQGHHHDYTKPLEVEWICRNCHIKQHKEERQELLPFCPYCKMRRVAMGLATCGENDCVLAGQKFGGTFGGRNKGRRGGLLNKDVRASKHLATGEHMLALMAEHGFDQAKLAEHLGVSSDYVSQVLQIVQEMREDRVERDKLNRS